jgi:hypothetical protein
MLATPRDAKYVEVIEKLTGKPLARRSMMDIEVREENRPRREGRDGKGGRNRGRGRDGKHHDRRPPGGKFHDHVASMEPAEVRQDAVSAAPAPAPQEAPREQDQKPRHHREKRSQRQHNEQAARPEAVDKSELPAFLFRPVPVRKPVSRPE